MEHCQTHILNALLDSYERSLLSAGENKVKIHISFPFTKKTLPEYFNESSLAYEDIHACMEQLKRDGFIEMIWKNGRAGNILQKVVLKEEKIPVLYQLLKRKPREEKIRQNKEFLVNALEKTESFVCRQFILEMLNRLEERKTIKEYLDLDEIEETRKLLLALCLVEGNKKEYYLREFSITHFADSKYMENVLGRITKIFKEFIPELREMDSYDILAEYSIYHTPNFVYFKGAATIAVNEERLNLTAFKEGIGLTGDSLENLRLDNTGEIEKVITIENLTTFFRWQEEKALIIYLGGYHNAVRCRLLQLIYESIPEAAYYHFGDMDWGGFRIYEHLCKKTRIPFRTYYMDCGTFKQYMPYAKQLTENDKRNLNNMLQDNLHAEYAVVLREMLRSGRKLEQECICADKKCQD